MTDFLYMVGGAFFILLINGIINYNKSWVGLTNEEREELMDIYDVASPDYAKAIEAKLKEKNNGT